MILIWVSKSEKITNEIIIKLEYKNDKLSGQVLLRHNSC